MTTKSTYRARRALASPASVHESPHCEGPVLPTATARKNPDLSTYEKTPVSGKGATGRHWTAVSVLGAIGLVALTGVAEAAPQACTNTATDTYTCSGNQSEGIDVNSEVPGSTTTTIVKDLTHDIDTGNLSVFWEIGGGSDIRTLEVDTGTFAIKNDGPERDALILTSTGSNGGNGSTECCETGKAGHNGEAGFSLNLTVDGTLTSAEMGGVDVQSVGGSGGGKGGAGANGVSGTVTYGSSGGGMLGTSGAQAHGIFAQSAGGSGSTTSTDTKVSVSVSADVEVSGSGAHGIFAQSVGDGMGQIEVTVNTGATVQGGSDAVISGADDGAGIFIKDGTTSTITNAGTIASVLGKAGIAINGVGTTPTIDNTGTITGQILKASRIDLLNRPGGLINAGPLLDVDNLTSQGALAVGGAGSIDSTRLTGTLTQSGSGVLAVDLDPRRAGGSNRGDRLSVGGRADLDGRLAINLLDTWQPVAGLQSVRVLTADGGLSFSGLEVTESAVAQYALDQPTPGALHVGYDIDFANAGILAATNDNQDCVARHIHGIYRAEALDADVARALIAIEDTASYTRLINSLGAEIAVDNQIASLLSGIRFNDALLSCAERAGDYRFFDQGQCGWLRLRGQRLERHESSDNLGFDENSWQIAGGGQIDVGNGWHLGAALSYEISDLNADASDAGSDGDRFQVGVSAKRRFDATELSGSLAIGYGDFDIDRNPWPGAPSNGTQRLWLYSGQLRVAHLFEYGRWRSSQGLLESVCIQAPI